jgi:hypothetical protein
MVFIGLGGSGGKTLRYLKRDIGRWLDEKGWEQEIPVGWQFLQIDSPTVQDGAEIKGVPMLPDEEYVGLIGKAMTFDQIDDLLMAESEVALEFASIRVNPAGLQQDVHTGAGMYRAIGSTIGAGYLDTIYASLKGCFDRINQADSQASLSGLYQVVHDGKQPTANQDKPLVVVISSLAGGTGAGLVNHVCDVLREMKYDYTFGLLYTPEVFESVVPADGGILPNGLAAMCEIVNGHWYHGGAGAGLTKIKRKESRVMARAKASQPISRSGPAFPFLIGARNSSGISYTSDVQLFEVVGAALTSWTTDIKVQSKLLGYTQSNWAAKASQVSVDQQNVVFNQGDVNNNEPGTNPFSALGFARVSVGNRYFKIYAAERIARDAFEFIRDNHTSGDYAKSLKTNQPNITHEELIQKQCEFYFPSFLSDCKLDQKNSQDMDTALLPSDADWHPVFQKCADLAGNLVTLSGNNKPADWLVEIMPAVGDAAEKFGKDIKPKVEENIRHWLEATPERLVQVVSQNVSRLGLPVTLALLKKLKDEITHPFDGIIQSLKDDIDQSLPERNPMRWSDNALSVFNDPSKKVPSGVEVEAALQTALAGAITENWIMIKEMAIELLGAFASEFLEPLIGSIQSAVYKADNEKGNFEEWPSWPNLGEEGSLSPNSTPPLSEYTVILPEEFPKLFDDLLKKTVGGTSTMIQEHHKNVCSEVLSGEFIEQFAPSSQSAREKFENLRPIIQTSRWIPRLNFDLKDYPGPSIATFNVNFGSEEILARTKQWLNKPGSAFKAVIDADLRTFTAAKADVVQNPDSKQLYEQRRLAFLKAFESAINASKPLVSLNEELMTMLLGAGHPYLDYDVSTLPFEQHPLEDAVKNRLQSALKNLPTKKDAEGFFSTDSGIKHIDIVSSLYGAYPLLVMQSLLEPIGKSWKSFPKEAGRKRAEFWNKRRSRSLEEFIPAPQEHIRCMLRGWYLGTMLGLIGKVNGQNKWSIATRMANQSAGYKEFPEYLLSSSGEWGDNAAIVLEALGLAYVDVGIQKNLEPLGAYINLLDLGRSGTGSDKKINSYSDASDYLVHWVKTGQMPDEAANDQRVLVQKFPSKIRGLSENSEPEERRSAVLRELRNLETTYDNGFKTYVEQLDEDISVLSKPPLWISMRALIQSALKQLIGAVEEMDLNQVKPEHGY